VGRKYERHAWHGVTVAIAGFDEQGELVIDDLTGYQDLLLKGLSAKTPRQGAMSRILSGTAVLIWIKRGNGFVG